MEACFKGAQIIAREETTAISNQNTHTSILDSQENMSVGAATQFQEIIALLETLNARMFALEIH